MPLYREQTGGGGGADVSGSFVLAVNTGSLPFGRQLTAGPNVTIQDNGPGSTIVIGAATSGSNQLPTFLGQVMFAASESLDRFYPSLPLVNDEGYLLTNDPGYLVVSASI